MSEIKNKLVLDYLDTVHLIESLEKKKKVLHQGIIDLHKLGTEFDEGIKVSDVNTPNMEKTKMNWINAGKSIPTTIIPEHTEEDLELLKLEAKRLELMEYDVSYRITVKKDKKE